MKIREISLIIIAFLVQCCGIFPSQKSFIIKNQYGRIQLKEMKFKESFDKSKIDLVDLNVIYYYHRENTNINMEFNFIIRFFKNGQYAFFANSKKPITHLSYEDINYNDLQKASYVGYYNIKGNTIIIELPNHLFRRSGKRNLNKYKVLSNGNLESITKSASDYGAIYKKTPINEKILMRTIPDW